MNRKFKTNFNSESLIFSAREEARNPKRRRRGNSCCAFHKLPEYKSDRVHRSVSKAIRKHELPVRVVYEHACSLKHQLCYSAQSPLSCIKEPNIRKIEGRGRPLEPCLTCKSGGVKVYLKRIVIYCLQFKLCREKYNHMSDGPAQWRRDWRNTMMKLEGALWISHGVTTCKLSMQGSALLPETASSRQCL